MGVNLFQSAPLARVKYVIPLGYKKGGYLILGHRRRRQLSEQRYARANGNFLYARIKSN